MSLEEKIEKAKALAEKNGLVFFGKGVRIIPVMSCFLLNQNANTN